MPPIDILALLQSILANSGLNNKNNNNIANMAIDQQTPVFGKLQATPITVPQLSADNNQPQKQIDLSSSLSGLGDNAGNLGGSIKKQFTPKPQQNTLYENLSDPTYNYLGDL